MKYPASGVAAGLAAAMVFSPTVLTPSRARAQSPTPPPQAAAPGQFSPPTPYPQPQYQQYPQQGYPQEPAYPSPAQPAPQGAYRTPPPTGYPQYQSSPYPPPQYGQYPSRYPPPQAAPPQYPQAGAYPAQPYRDSWGRPYPPPQPPPPAAPAPSATAPVPARAQGARLALTTGNEAARSAALACHELAENYHLEAARARCADALAKDPLLALAHLWMAQIAATPAIAATELDRAVALAKSASPGERGLVDGYRAWREGRLTDARKIYDLVVRGYPGERRMLAARGQFRQVALGDPEGAAEDYKKAIALDEKYPALQNYLTFALADAGRPDEALAAARKYAELAPNEPNARDSLAALALRRGDANEAIALAQKALALDPKFAVAHGTLGDAYLAQGKPKDARREYGLLEAEGDGALKHDGAMRSARSLLYEDRTLEGERALVREADSARKAGRLADAAATFLEVARDQVERGALTEAGRGIHEATESLKKPADAAAPSLDELDRGRLEAQLVEVRALALAALGERELAEARAADLAEKLKAAGDPRADDRARFLKGWIAWRSGDDAGAIAALDHAGTPPLRLAYAQALARSGDAAKARPVMEDLARRTSNDAETALARPRAVAWLKTAPAQRTAATTSHAAAAIPPPPSTGSAVITPAAGSIASQSGASPAPMLSSPPPPAPPPAPPPPPAERVPPPPPPSRP